MVDAQSEPNKIQKKNTELSKEWFGAQAEQHTQAEHYDQVKRHVWVG